MKSIIVALLMLIVSSNLYSQTEYKILYGSFGTSCNTINELASNGFSIINYFIDYDKIVDYTREVIVFAKNNSENVQKSYIKIFAERRSGADIMYLYGDLPAYIKNKYEIEDNKRLENIINELSKKGYQVEHFISEINNLGILSVILSKIKSDITSVRNTNTNDNNIVIEKARYNLNGVPINKNEKGIQIVVYSDYSTKIINVK